MNKLKQEIESRPKYADPTTTLAEVEKKVDLLVAETKAIFSTPAPKAEEPAPEQAKTENNTNKGGEETNEQAEKPATTADVEMN